MNRHHPFIPWRAYAIVATVALLGLAVVAHRVGWRNVLLTPDQRGWVLMARQQPAEAAKAFRDPLRRGTAFYRAGDYKAAAQAFAGADTAESNYDQANALVMLGQYDDAMARYDRALVLRPGWADATGNRAIAHIRADRLKSEGGTETQTKPDEIVFDKTKKGGTDTKVQGGETPMSDEAVRAMWLKRVETRPADFLRLRFAYQSQMQASNPSGNATGQTP
ncbi:MAG: tetratricopeptide repeat protein [Bradyrhizobium sp.]